MDITRKETYQFSSGGDRSEGENKMIINQNGSTITVSYHESQSASSSSSMSGTLISNSTIDIDDNKAK